jgi:aryl-alcohol dehydrogenase-like predicted oxidoreductase
MAEAGSDNKLTTLKNYKLLGRSGLCVSPLCYGTMNIADKDMADDATSKKLIDSFMDQGGNFFDTANMYEGGKSETLLGQILSDKRDRVVLATKFSGGKTPGDPNSGGNSRKNLMQSLDASLKRLGTDYIDVMYVHMWNYRTPVEEVMRSLDDVVRSGKVHYIGISDTPAWKVAQANTIATLRGWSPFIAMQTQYSLVERTAERDIVPMCREMEIGMCHWGPLAQGMLTGKYDHLTVEAGQELLKGGLASASNRTEQRAAMGSVDTFRPKAVLGDWNEKNRAISLEVSAIGEEIGRPASQVALNWNLQKPGTTSPIVAPRTQAQLDDAIAALSFRLTSDQMLRLDEVSKICMGFPQRWGDASGITYKGDIAVERRPGSFLARP